MMFNRNVCITVIFISLFFVFSQASEILTPEDVVDLKYVTSTAISPDGNNIAYVLRVQREAGDKPGNPYYQIWVTDRGGKNMHRITPEKEESNYPLWSPDGKNIAFLSKRDSDKATQIYLTSITGEEAHALTESKTNVKKHQWSPDGKYIAYLAKDAESLEEKMDKESGKDWEVFEQNDKNTRIWLYNIAEKESSILTIGDYTVWEYVWGPDSKTIYFAGTDKPLTDYSYMFRKIYAIQMGGQPEPLYDPKGKLEGMSVSPDGKKLAFLGGLDINDPTYGTLFTLDLASRKSENISGDFIGTNRWVQWMKGNQVITVTEQGVWTNVLSWDVSTKQYKTIIKEGPIIYHVNLLPSLNHFAFSASTPEHPYELFVGNMDGKYTRLTDSNPGLKGMEFGSQEPIDWKARDGLTIQGILLKPIDFSPDKKYPLILQIHGGPEHCFSNGWNNSYNRWSQLLAQRGYMVLMPNYRGSTGRGVDYAAADHHDLAGKEFDDVLDGIKFLVEEKGWVDPNKVGIGGGSYGGYFSAWAATKHSAHFAAAVDFAGISNWISFIGTTDIPRENSLVHWALDWMENKENETLVWDRSPMAHIRNAQTPTLIANGEKDLRVPKNQSYELYRGLEMRNVPVEFVIYPREQHGLKEREHQLDYMYRVLNWFDKYVLKGNQKKEVSTTSDKKDK
jgi:dipeptidyl aminopeptidase/acylaminoacyl peptidase